MILEDDPNNLNNNLTEEEQMIMEEVLLLLQEKEEETKRNTLSYKNASIWSDANYQPKTAYEIANKHSFSIYADKLLVHLVIEEEFNFNKISQIMSYTFHYEPTNTYSEENCRERWFEMHRDRLIQPEIKEKEMENKRIKSILGFNDPFILYNIDEKLMKMEKDDGREMERKNLYSELEGEEGNRHDEYEEQEPKYIEINYKGYSIFKDSIRKIDNVEKHNELHQHMRQALQKASESIELEKPMLYTPYYDRLEQFEVLEEELTTERMQQLMSHPIEMELMERELKVMDLNERQYESRIKKEVEKKVKKEKIKNEEEFEIEEDWDEYESD